jgi:hypothetical protein
VGFTSIFSQGVRYGEGESGERKGAVMVMAVRMFQVSTLRTHPATKGGISGSAWRKSRPVLANKGWSFGHFLGKT